jgi:hypothetical protein
MRNPKITLLSKLLIASVFILGIVSHSRSQDIIIKKDNEELKVKIIEVGTTEIKYKFFDAPDGPTMVIEKKEVKTLKIKGQNGKIISMDENKPDPMSISNTAILDKTSSLKFNFFSPLTHQLAFNYEWMIRPGFNWETGISVVGPGVGIFDQLVDLHPKGFIVRTGCKFLLGNSSDVEVDGGRYAHPLKGRYFKIETILYDISTDYNANANAFNNLNGTYSSTIVPVHDNFVGATLDLVYGRQWIFGNSITVGWFIGVGYAFENKTCSYAAGDIDTGSRYAFEFLGNSLPIAATFGFNIGFICKTPYWLSNMTSPRVSNTTPSRHSLAND